MGYRLSNVSAKLDSPPLVLQVLDETSLGWHTCHELHRESHDEHSSSEIPMRILSVALANFSYPLRSGKSWFLYK